MAKVNVRMTADELNRFIGEDDELALHLKGSIVQQFAKRHLKAVMSGGLDKATESIRASMKDIMEKELVKVKGIGFGEKQVIINVDIKKKIEQECKHRVHVILEGIIEDITKKIIGESMQNLEETIVERVLYRYMQTKASNTIKLVEDALLKSKK